MKLYLAILASTLIAVACGNRTLTSGGAGSAKSVVELAVLDASDQVQNLRGTGSTSSKGDILFGAEVRETTKKATSEDAPSSLAQTELHFWVMEAGQPIAQIQLELPKKPLTQFQRIKENCVIDGKPGAEFCKLKSAFVKKLVQDRLGNTRVLYHYLSENFAATADEKTKAIRGCTLELQHQNLDWQQALNHSATPDRSLELYRYVILRSDRNHGLLSGAADSGQASSGLSASLTCYRAGASAANSASPVSVFRGMIQFGQFGQSEASGRTP